MATRIKFNGTGDGIVDNGVHFCGVFNDYTLCGLTLDGDKATAGEFYNTKKKVNCRDCISIVEFSKSISKSEYET